jgi:hypothetical protein
MFAGFDDRAAIYILNAAKASPHCQRRGNLTGRAQTSRSAQCECEKGSDRPPTDMEAGREGPVSGEGGNRPRVYITDPKKNCLAGFATIERILR